MSENPKPAREEKTSQTQSREDENLHNKILNNEIHTHSKNREREVVFPALYVRMAKWKNWVVFSLPTHVRVNDSDGGVCMWARTDSLATHHCPTNIRGF